MSNRFNFLLLVALLAAVPFFFVDTGRDPTHPIWQLNPIAHIVFFALLSCFIAKSGFFSRFPFVWSAAGILGAIFIIGGAIELAQGLMGRTPSWKDMGLNMLGAMSGLLFLAPMRTRLSRQVLRAGQGSVLILVLAVSYGPMTTLWDMRAASKQFPVLSNFESRFEDRRWSSGEIDSSVSRSGRASLRVELQDSLEYPGTTLKYGFGNWQEFSYLALSLYNPDPEPLRIHISIRDYEHRKQGRGFGDRFDQSFTLQQGWKDILIPVSEIEHAPAGRRLDLSRLTSLVVFAMDLPRPRTVYLDNVYLVPVSSMSRSFIRS